MRMELELDENLVHRACELTGLESKRAVVEEALRTLIRRYEQEDLRRLRGKLHWEGCLSESRGG